MEPPAPQVHFLRQQDDQFGAGFSSCAKEADVFDWFLFEVDRRAFRTMLKSSV
jgi:hypothetical protein